MKYYDKDFLFPEDAQHTGVCRKCTEDVSFSPTYGRAAKTYVMTGFCLTCLAAVFQEDKEHIRACIDTFSADMWGVVHSIVARETKKDVA